MELTSSHKHIKNTLTWNNSQGKVTGNWYKDLHTTETERKIWLAVQARKKSDRVGTYACGWKLRGKERSQGRTFVLGVSGLNHRLGVPVPVWGDTSPHGYWENCENRQKGGEAQRRLMRGGQALVQGAERSVLAVAAVLCSSVRAERTPSPTQSTSQHVLDLGHPGPGQRLGLRVQRWPGGAGCSPGRQWRLAQEAQKQPTFMTVAWGQTSCACLAKYTSLSWANTPARLTLSHRTALDLQAPQPGKGANMGCIWAEVLLSAEADLDVCKYTGPLAAGLPSFGAKAPVQGEVKIHTKGNRASSSLNFQDSALATW